MHWVIHLLSLTRLEGGGTFSEDNCSAKMKLMIVLMPRVLCSESIQSTENLNR